jgi:hypothetical protein
MRRTRIAVITGNFQQYLNFLEEDWPGGGKAKDNQMFEFFYAGEKNSLRGFRGQVLLRGEYMRSPCWEYYDKEYRHYEYVNNQLNKEWDE